MASGKKLSAGKKAMFREALSKQAKGESTPTKMTNVPKPKHKEKKEAMNLEGDYSRAPKEKKISKKKPGKANVPH